MKSFKLFLSEWVDFSYKYAGDISNSNFLAKNSKSIESSLKKLNLAIRKKYHKYSYRKKKNV
jgi:hypothetical protein